MSHEAVLRDIAGRLPGTPDPKKRQIFLALMAVGLVAFAYLLFTNPLRAWGSWTINTLYFLGIAEGGVVLAAAMLRMTSGRRSGSMTCTIPVRWRKTARTVAACVVMRGDPSTLHFGSDTAVARSPICRTSPEICSRRCCCAASKMP